MRQFPVIRTGTRHDTFLLSSILACQVCMTTRAAAAERYFSDYQQEIGKKTHKDKQPPGTKSEVGFPSNRRTNWQKATPETRVCGQREKIRSTDLR